MFDKRNDIQFSRIDFSFIEKMIVITFAYLYSIYGIVIFLVYLSILISKNYNSERILHYLCVFCSILSISIPILFKIYSTYFEYSNALVSIFSAVTGFLFALKILELAFTYSWSQQKQITFKQILEDFSTFPKYKYEKQQPKKNKSKARNSTLLNHLNYLLLGNDEDYLSARQQNLLIICRGLVHLVCLHILLRLTPYSVLRLHSQNARFFSIVDFLTYTLYGFLFYFALGMIINIVFGSMGFIWNIYTRPIYPGYPFLPVGIHDFWSRRWNIYVKSILHRLAFIALPKLTGFQEKSNVKFLLAGIFAFVLSGLLHEFMYSVSMNRWSGGRNMLFFLFHGLFIAIELSLQGLFKRKTVCSPIIGWLYTIIALYATAPLFCDPWIETDCFATLKTHLG